MKSAPVTLGIVNYNGIEVLSETLRCAYASNPAPASVLVVDNGSTDGSVDGIEDRYPGLRLIALSENRGAAMARNRLLTEAETELVMLLDNDISLQADTLGLLIEFMSRNPQAGACHPEIEDPNDPDAYHYNGGSIHYLGALIARDKPGAVEDRPEAERFVTVSGAALMVRKSLALSLGGMDADYFFNWEDGDFTCRLTLAGHPCYNIPAARVLHRAKPRGTSKAFYQVRNRWHFMLKLYGLRTLILMTPALLLFELLQMILLHGKGAGLQYWRANLAVIRELPRIRTKRKTFATCKLIPDRDWLTVGTMYLPPSFQSRHFLNPCLQFMNVFFAFYWKCIRSFCSR